jgi:hypothetical protein
MDKNLVSLKANYPSTYLPGEGSGLGENKALVSPKWWEIYLFMDFTVNFD